MWPWCEPETRANGRNCRAGRDLGKTWRPGWKKCRFGSARGATRAVALAGVCVADSSNPFFRGDSLAAARDAAGTGRGRICLRRAVDSARHSSVRTCLQHEIAGDVCGVRGDSADFWRDGGRDTCWALAGKRWHDAADVLSGAAAVRRSGGSDSSGRILRREYAWAWRF